MDERGGSVNVEMALLWGVLTLLILAVVQVVLVFYAGQLAHTAAQDGLRTGRYLSTASATSAAQRDAREFLDRTAGTVLTDPSVTAAVDGATVRVRVTGTVLSLVPGVPIVVTREATGGLEQVSP